ncbi:MAG: ExbD/TolR family protein [Nitrospinae bacterium]|nr:ExbD/TolR family protein [Nitrospinota bacterium]
MHTPIKRRITTTLSEINVTPFIDVMLVLLVIFMVTTPLLEKGINVDLPKEPAKDVDVIEKSVITVNKNHEIFFNETRVSLDDIETFLKNAYSRKMDKEIFLRADRELPYGFVIKVMSKIKNAGIERVGMVTEPVESGL